MTRTAISPRLATSTLVNIRARHAIRPPDPRPPRTIDIQRPSPPPGPGRPTALRRRTRARRSCCGPRLARFDDDRVVTSDLAARARDRGAARLPGRAARRRASARSTSASGRARRSSDFPSGTETAWRGGPLKAPDGESWERLRRRASAAPSTSWSPPAAPGSWSATAASCARPSRTSPARTRGGSRARRTPASRSSGPGRRRMLESYGWVPRSVSAADGRGIHRKFFAEAALEPPTSLSHPGAFCRERRKGGNRPAGKWGRRAGRLPRTPGLASRGALDALDARGARPTGSAAP